MNQNHLVISLSNSFLFRFLGLLTWIGLIFITNSCQDPEEIYNETPHPQMSIRFNFSDSLYQKIPTSQVNDSTYIVPKIRNLRIQAYLLENDSVISMYGNTQKKWWIFTVNQNSFVLEDYSITINGQDSLGLIEKLQFGFVDLVGDTAISHLYLQWTEAPKDTLLPQTVPILN